jgi:hypothetical protein
LVVVVVVVVVVVLPGFDTNFRVFPNFSKYGVMNVVIIVTTPNTGKTELEIAPMSCPALTTTKDNSPLAADIPIPVLRAVVFPYLAIDRIPLTKMNFEETDTAIRMRPGIKKNGTSDMSMSAPMEIKNNAANISLKGVVITRATEELFASAIRTPAKNAPVATESPIDLAKNERKKARPRIDISIKA